MDRNLKERLVGAAVLVAAAVAVIPSMLPRLADESSGEGRNAATAEGGALKTYTIDLTKAGQASGATAETTLAPPPEQPEELPRIETEKPPPAVAAQDRATTENQTIAAPAARGLEPTPAPAPAAAKKTESAAAQPSANTEVLTVPRSAHGEWAVQVASFGVRATSDRIASELKAKGLPAFVTASEVKGKTMYRVRVGPADTRAEADELLRKVKSSHPGANVVTHP